jgi:hypothetical protein
MSVSFLRHAGWFSPEYTQDVTLNIIGVGATGSNIGLLCAKMGFHSFRVFDPDIVESHNLPNQAYDSCDINTKKVDAFERVLTTFNPLIKVEKHDYYFDSSQHTDLLIDGPLLLTVDSMKARKDIYNAFENNFEIQNVFEPRMGFTYAELNIIDNFSASQLREWVTNLKTDEEIPESACNMRIITTLTGMISSHTAHQICDSVRSSYLQQPFKYKKKTIFNLNEDQNLSVYSL